MIRVIFLGLALFALVLPIVGPLDDHHFAERTHTHGHIYLDGYPAPHGHVFDAAQQHTHTIDGLASMVLFDREIPDGVAAFTTPTASLLLAVINAPWNRAPDAMRPPQSTDRQGNLLTSFVASLRHPDGRQVAPPVPPPII